MEISKVSVLNKIVVLAFIIIALNVLKLDLF